MNERMNQICQILRYSTQLELKITDRAFNENTTHEGFQEAQKALENLKKDSELEITETCHRKLKLKPQTTRTITIKMKQTRGLTPLEKHERFKFPPVKKPRYNWGQRTYLRIKDHETMKRIKANRLISTHCRGQMNF